MGGRGTATIRRRGRATVGRKGEEKKKEDPQMVCKREREGTGKKDGKNQKRCGEEDGVKEHTKWERGKERKGKERKGKERKGKERKGKERKGKGKERKGKERRWHFALFSLSRPNVALLDSLEKSSRGNCGPNRRHGPPNVSVWALWSRESNTHP